MPSSREAVLQTAELLQEILLNLDMRTLLTAAQRVSRQWRELVTSSPALQQALYFEPMAESSGIATQNPLLAEIFPLWFPKETQEEQLDVDEVDEIEEWPKVPEREDFDSLEMAQESRRHAFMHPTATWRRMLVRQPPVRSLGCWTVFHGRGGDHHEFALHEFPDGLRMDHLYDLAQDWVRQLVSSFNVFWDPNATISYAKSRFRYRLEPHEEEELESFASQGNIVLLRYMVVQCCKRGPDVHFEEKFTFAPSKEQQDSWQLSREQSGGRAVRG
ncbi:hypothetical protein F5Y03DRAFT_343396 [Xylaria venustula]|nr:hypothetical protein F5Y03DRAFT_343396 [Xylaria venustula]